MLCLIATHRTLLQTKAFVVQGMPCGHTLPGYPLANLGPHPPIAVLYQHVKSPPLSPFSQSLSLGMVYYGTTLADPISECTLSASAVSKVGNASLPHYHQPNNGVINDISYIGSEHAPPEGS